MSGKTHKVYVYGTLRTGEGPTVEIPGEMYDLGWYPGVKLTDDGSTFVAEVLEVDEKTFEGFDQYEGYNPDHPESSLYLRVQYKDGWLYVYNAPIDQYKRVKSGDWLVYSGNEGYDISRFKEREEEPA